MSIHVLHVGKYYEPYRGGIETLLKSVCDRPGDGITAEALVANHGPGTVVDLVDGVRVTRAATAAVISSIPFCPSLPLWIRRRPADIICLHEPNPMALLSYMLVRHPGRLVIWFHSEIIGRPLFSAFYRPWLNAALSIAARIVITSPAFLEHTKVLAPYASKCVVIPSCVRPERFELTSELAAKAEAIRQRAGKRVVLFVGRLTYYKGLEWLIDAMRNIDARLLIVGTGPRRGELEATVTSKGLTDRIEFVGEVDDASLAAYYHACDVFVLPSVQRAEAFGLVQVEAMTCAKPVVSTRIPTGVPWVNQHGVTGLVVEPESADSLADAVNRLLEDPSLRESYGRQGRARVESEFTEELTLKRASDLYRSVMAGRGSEQAAYGPAVQEGKSDVSGCN
jgi:glycosyltransferase involved in cell wall biosynthesis